MPISDLGFLAKQRFIVQAQAFDYQGSAALQRSEQRIFVTDSSTGSVNQLVVQLNEDESASAFRPIDGLAQSKDLLVAFLEPKRFLLLLERLYAAQRANQTLVISLESDEEGRIATFEPRVLKESDRPGPIDDFDELDPMPDWGQVG